MSVYTPCSCRACGDQIRTSDLLKLDLQMAVSPMWEPESSARVKVLLIAKPSLHPHKSDI